MASNRPGKSMSFTLPNDPLAAVALLTAASAEEARQNRVRREEAELIPEIVECCRRSLLMKAVLASDLARVQLLIKAGASLVQARYCTLRSVHLSTPATGGRWTAWGEQRYTFLCSMCPAVCFLFYPPRLYESPVQCPPRARMRGLASRHVCPAQPTTR